MNYVIFDLETTGLIPYLDKVITGYFIKCDEQLNILDELYVTFRPECSKRYWSLEAQKVHGITFEIAKGFDAKEYSFNKIDKFITDSVLVCYANYRNMVGNFYFDVSFIKALYDDVKGHGSFYGKINYVMSIHSIVKKINPDIRSRSLKDICERYGIEIGNHHEAKSDAFAAYEILKKMMVHLPDYYEKVTDQKKIADFDVKEACV